MRVGSLAWLAISLTNILALLGLLGIVTIGWVWVFMPLMIAGVVTLARWFIILLIRA